MAGAPAGGPSGRTSTRRSTHRRSGRDASLDFAVTPAGPRRLLARFFSFGSSVISAPPPEPPSPPPVCCPLRGRTADAGGWHADTWVRRWAARLRMSFIRKGTADGRRAVGGGTNAHNNLLRHQRGRHRNSIPIIVLLDRPPPARPAKAASHARALQDSDAASSPV